MPNVYVRALRRAVNLYGGAARMAALLRSSESQIQAWLYGSEPIPADTFLRVVDLLATPPGDEGPLQQPIPNHPEKPRDPGCET